MFSVACLDSCINSCRDKIWKNEVQSYARISVVKVIEKDRNATSVWWVDYSSIVYITKAKNAKMWSILKKKSKIIDKIHQDLVPQFAYLVLNKMNIDFG